MITVKKIKGNYIAFDGKEELHRIGIKKSGYSMEEARNIFKKYGTFQKGIYEQRLRLTNFEEIYQYAESEKLFREQLIAAGKKYQISVGTYGIGTARKGIFARSDKHLINNKETLAKAVKEAENRFFGRVDYHVNHELTQDGGYDANEGLRYVSTRKLHVNYGVVFYRKLKRNNNAIEA